MALNHVLNKPDKIVATGLGLLEQDLVIPNLFQKEGIDQFKGAANDSVSIEVEGLLPFGDYPWRSGEDTAGDTPANGRQKITFDQYTERKVVVTFGGNVVSAVEMTDEQKDFDFSTWTEKILKKQVRAVGRGLQRRSVNTLTGAPYEVAIGDLGALSSLRPALLEARRVLNRFNIPQEGRFLIVGTDFESVLLSDPEIKLAQNSGDDVAETALREATLGRVAGFNIIVDNTIPAGDAYAMVSNGFIMLTGAPTVPQSVKHGATQSFEGIAMRWITDYSADYLVDRSVVNTYAGFREVKDNLVWWDNAANREKVTATEHFVRGIKLQLDGPTVYPAAGSDLALATGIHTGPSSLLIPTAATGPSTPADD